MAWALRSLIEKRLREELADDSEGPQIYEDPTAPGWGLSFGDPLSQRDVPIFPDTVIQPPQPHDY